MPMIRTISRKPLLALLALGLGLPLLSSVPAVAQTSCYWHTYCVGSWTRIWGIIPVYNETCRETMSCFVES